MKLRNISASKYEFSVKKEGDPKVHTTAVAPGGEIEIEDTHPESMKKLAEHYPKDWVVVEEKKKSAKELRAELEQREKEEAEAKKKAADEAKAKAEADKAGKEKKDEK